MTDLKLTAIAALVFSSVAVHAGTMGPQCRHDTANVPCPAVAFDAKVEALYLQPVYDTDMGYWDALRVNNAFGGNTETRTDHQPAWGWAFKAQGSYHFRTGNDLTIDWYHFQRARTREHLFSRDFITPGRFTDFYLEAENNNQWDAVHLEFGQHIDFGVYEKIRFHAGVAYAYLKSEEASAAYLGPLALNTFTAEIGTMSRFNGFGPRMGAEFSYDWGDVRLYAHTAASLLLGYSRFTDALYLNPLVGTTGFSLAGSKFAAVPELEAKLGASYTYVIDECSFTMDIGYMWLNYFNALHGMAYVAPTVVESDFALHGPYLGFKWVGVV